MTDRYGVRPGEEAVDLPAQTDAGVYFIGRIHTPWQRREDCPKNARESEAVCTIEVDARWTKALKDVETCSHLVVLYWMDKARRDLALQVPRHYGERRGTFALRSPARPNPIAMSVVRLLKVEGRTLSVVGLDCLDGTALLDIKPYFASTDSVPEAVAGWHAAREPKGQTLNLRRTWVSFEFQQLTETSWRICAASPAGEILYVDANFKTEDEAMAWLKSDERRNWLKAQGWERWDVDE